MRGVGFSIVKFSTRLRTDHQVEAGNLLGLKVLNRSPDRQRRQPAAASLTFLWSVSTLSRRKQASLPTARKEGWIVQSQRVLSLLSLLI
jgi:hypothetical protein